MQVNVDINKTFASQLPKNLIANIVYFIVNIIIGIILVPFFISTLGVAAYGLIPLAASITGYVGIIVQSLNSAVSRFLTIDLQQEEYAIANRTFNTAVFGISALVLAMIPVVILIAYLVPYIFNIPAEQQSDVIILFLGVFAAFLIGAWSGNFTVPLFAYNRIDLQNVVNICNILLQIGLIIVSFKLFNPSLAFVGMAYVASALLSSALAIVLSKRICPHLKVSISSIDLSRMRSLIDMSFWAIVNQIGSLLFLQIDLIAVNLLFGATASGEYAIALTWAILLRNFAGVIGGVLAPMVFTYYAKGQMETLTRMMISAVKLMGLLIALPIGLLCGFAPQLLTVWVGDKFAFLAPLIVLMVLHLTINLAVLPLFSINVAYNKIKLPGIITLLTGCLNVSLAFSLPLLLGWGFYGVAAAGAIILTLKNAFFTPWYATRVMGVQTRIFIRSLLVGIIAAILLMAASMVVSILVPITSLISLIIVGIILGLVYISLIWKLGFSNDERELFRSYLPERIRRVVV